MLRVLTWSLISASRSTAKQSSSIALDCQQHSIPRRQLNNNAFVSLMGRMQWTSSAIVAPSLTRIQRPSYLPCPRPLFYSQTRPAAASERRRPPVAVYQTWKDAQKQKDTFGLLAALKAADAQVIQDAHTYTPTEACSILASRAVYIHPAPSEDFIDAIESQLMAHLDELGCQDTALLLKVYGTCEQSLPLNFDEVFPSLEQHAEKIIKGFTALDIQNTLAGLNAMAKYQPSVGLLQALIKHADRLCELVERLEKQERQ